MKILLTTDTRVPAINGVVTSTATLRAALTAQGHEVWVLTLSGDSHTYTKDGVTSLGSLDAGLVYPGARLRAPALNRAIRDLIDWRPDIVHSQCEFSTFAPARRIAHAAGAPLIHTYHTVYEDYTHYFSPSRSMGRKMAALFTRMICAGCDAVIAPTPKISRLLAGYSVHCPVRIIPTGLDLQRFAVPRDDALRSRLGLPPKEANKTVLLSLFITFISLLLPIFNDSYGLMLCAFSLLGIGNALMQTSLNPLLSNIISGNKLASSLTFGQFIKAIASFLAPYLAMWGATQTIPSFGLGWRVLFPIYMVIAVIATIWLNATSIKEEAPDQASGFKACLSLLGRPFILLCFIGIICHVGIDVGTNTTAPKILMERLGITLEEAGFATSLYFIFRTAGCLSGALILQKIKARSFFLLSVCCMLAAMILLLSSNQPAIIYAAIALIGFGNSNVFSIIFSQALLAVPEKKNEISGLMIMGLFGGTIFPLLMGVASDAVGQNGAVAVMTLGVIYLLFYTLKIKH